MPLKVAMMTSGRVMLGMIVAHSLRRNAKITRTTSPIGQQQSELDIRDRGADVDGAVGNEVDIYRARDRCFEPWQHLLDLVDDLDRIRPWLQLEPGDRRLVEIRMVDPPGRAMRPVDPHPVAYLAAEESVARHLQRLGLGVEHGVFDGTQPLADNAPAAGRVRQ